MHLSCNDIRLVNLLKAGTDIPMYSKGSKDSIHRRIYIPHPMKIQYNDIIPTFVDAYIIDETGKQIITQSQGVWVLKTDDDA